MAKRKADDALAGLFGEYASDDEGSADEGPVPVASLQPLLTVRAHTCAVDNAEAPGWPVSLSRWRAGQAEDPESGVVLVQYQEQQTGPEAAVSIVIATTEEFPIQAGLRTATPADGEEMDAEPPVDSTVPTSRPDDVADLTDDLPASLCEPPLTPVDPALQASRHVCSYCPCAPLLADSLQMPLQLSVCHDVPALSISDVESMLACRTALQLLDPQTLGHSSWQLLLGIITCRHELMHLPTHVHNYM